MCAGVCHSKIIVSPPKWPFMLTIRQSEPRRPSSLLSTASTISGKKTLHGVGGGSKRSEGLWRRGVPACNI